MMIAFTPTDQPQRVPRPDAQELLVPRESSREKSKSTPFFRASSMKAKCFWRLSPMAASVGSTLAGLVSDLHPILGPGAGMLENHLGVLKLFTHDVAVESSFSLTVHR